MNQTIRFDRHGFIFSGDRRFILAGTINYFRLHPSEWRGRLEAFRACGFNTVDTYVPWNYHETAEGQFDFSTFNRDLRQFLSLCGELGLWVYFRPGPYICNEWDGGGLPAWLFTKADVTIRQNQPAYLRYVLRYLHQVNEIARDFVYTKGGPIILYALENELDFYPCRDTHGYISALKEQALKDGIDVPLTGCIGMRTRLKAAMGLVDGIIPSPNVYVTGAIEHKATWTYLRVLAGEYASGRHMDDVPVFVTEMNRDEDTLRRVFAGGFKGLSPFNFSGGTHYGYWNASNNWGGQTLISSSIDFASQIQFDGSFGESYFASRLLAGLINAFEQPILACSPTNSDDGGPSSSNANLGWKEAPESPGHVYSLVHGNSALMFLYNGSDQPQELQAEFQGTRIPQHSTTQIAARYTHIVVIGMPMNRSGIDATIAWSTAEIAQLRQTDDGAELVLYGPESAAGEIRIQSEQSIRLRDGDAEVHPDGEHATTLVVQFGKTATTRLWIGEKLLTLTILTRDAAARYRLDVPQLKRGEKQELAGATWHLCPMQPQPLLHQWQGQPQAMENLGILQGAAWYEMRCELGQELSGELSIEHAAEFVSIFVDGQYLATFLGNGGELKVALPATLPPGAHTLRFRTEIWGHSNFDEKAWPSGRLGSLRGIFGELRIGGIAIPGHWSCGVESLVSTDAGQAHQGAIASTPGQSAEFAIDLPQLPNGGTLILDGKDVIGDIFLGSEMVGRFAFGPAMPIKMTGGPGNEFHLPAPWTGDGGKLRLMVRSVVPEGALTSVGLCPMAP